MIVTTKVEFDFTEAPAYLTKLIIKRHGDKVYLKVRKRNGNDQAEVELSASEFFSAIDRLR